MSFPRISSLGRQPEPSGWRGSTQPSPMEGAPFREPNSLPATGSAAAWGEGRPRLRAQQEHLGGSKKTQLSSLRSVGGAEEQGPEPPETNSAQGFLPPPPPLSKAALTGSELPVPGDSCKTGQTLVRTSTERMREGRGAVNRDIGSGVPLGPLCDFGRSMAGLKSLCLLLYKTR